LGGSAVNEKNKYQSVCRRKVDISEEEGENEIK
jgi:hypothetical protein